MKKTGAYQQPDKGQCNAEQQRKGDGLSDIFKRLFPVAVTDGIGNQRGCAGGDSRSQGDDHKKHRKRQRHCGQRIG